MSRALAVLVGVAMLSASWPAAMPHVHAYTTHDHPDHHHGPERHVHTKGAGHHARGISSPIDSHSGRLEACDPGEHAVTLSFNCVSPGAHHVAVLAPTPALTLAYPPERRGYLAPSDVRAHSPPELIGSPPRAPPSVSLA